MKEVEKIQLKNSEENFEIFEEFKKIRQSLEQSEYVEKEIVDIVAEIKKKEEKIMGFLESKNFQQNSTGNLRSDHHHLSTLTLQTEPMTQRTTARELMNHINSLQNKN